MDWGVGLVCWIYEISKSDAVFEKLIMGAPWWGSLLIFPGETK